AWRPRRRSCCSRRAMRCAGAGPDGGAPVRGPRRSTGIALLALSLLALGGDAAARKFQMSGTWIYRNGQTFIPLQVGKAVQMSGIIVHASMGDLSGAYGFPNGPIPGAGGVTATGSAPATLRVPAHRFVEDAMALIPLPAISQTISSNFGVDAPYAAAM